MSVIKSFSVGNGDMFYINHNSDNFTLIDCNLNADNVEDILAEIKESSSSKGVFRFISSHPDQDHFGGIELLDDYLGIKNFYVVMNAATKEEETISFQRYCELRDGEKAFYISAGCSRKWMNLEDDVRGSSGINVLWPNTANKSFIEALEKSKNGESPNNISTVIRYEAKDGASALWLGDLETNFMEAIADEIELAKTTIVFASHHGRASGKIPNSWLEKLDPQIIVLGESPSRHLHYYTGYKTITQNSAGDIIFDIENNQVHVYVKNDNYKVDFLKNKNQNKFNNYIGSITVETEYTLE